VSPREPLVSVGIPTYNRASGLKRAVGSALAQSYENLEVVISDNASTDGTRELCESLARSDPRVRYHRQPENRGPTANFREVLDRASGEFFMWLADDDWIDTDYVSACVGERLHDPATALVAGRAAYYEGSRPLFTEPPLVLDSDDRPTKPR
jgi:glycosyltransferase involved in cell wall biosynthesis